jgi:hypothetical protein
MTICRIDASAAAAGDPPLLPHQLLLLHHVEAGDSPAIPDSRI